MRESNTPPVHPPHRPRGTKPPKRHHSPKRHRIAQDHQDQVPRSRDSSHSKIRFQDHQDQVPRSSRSGSKIARQFPHLNLSHLETSLNKTPLFQINLDIQTVITPASDIPPPHQRLAIKYRISIFQMLSTSDTPLQDS